MLIICTDTSAAELAEGRIMLADYQRDAVRRGLTQGTIEKRMSILTRCQEALGRPLVKATHLELAAWLDRHRLHPRTRYAYISHLAAFYRWAVDEELTDRDPSRRLARPKIRLGLPRPLDPAALWRLVDEADPTTAAMVALGFLAGLRCMEIAALDAADVMTFMDPPAIFVPSGKGGRPRVVPAGPDLLELLAAHGVPAQGPVFRRGDGSMWPAWRVSHHLRAHMHDCGVIASGHQLRHSFATEVYRRSGGDLRLTQELLGHSSPTTTSVYAAWAQERAGAVVAALFPRTA